MTADNKPSYTTPLPKLQDYDISAVTGFLPDKLPCLKLPNYYEPWEFVVRNISALMLADNLRETVAEMPVLNCENLTSEQEYRRAYSILGYIAHAYIWGISNHINRLPDQIALPWLTVSQHLDMPPIATYAGLVLWNWGLIKPTVFFNFDDEQIFKNIKTLNSFTGSSDESWFYLVSVRFEVSGAPCLTTGLKAIEYARKDCASGVEICLKKLGLKIHQLADLLMEMEQQCDPYIFYYKIRPYLAGWKNMTKLGLPGVYYGDHSDRVSLYSGGSNAQSSLIQALDLFLNIDHYSTGDGRVVSNSPFMAEMQKYMPGKHREFLQELSKVNILRDYAVKHGKSHPEVLKAYNNAVFEMKKFRDKHIQLVTLFIISQARKGKGTTKRTGLANSKSTPDIKGTGGTLLIPFLKQCRDETGEKILKSEKKY